MTLDDILDLAEKAGCDVSAMDAREYQTMWCDSEQLERFAASLIQAGAASRDAEIAELVEALEHSVLYVPDLATVPGIAAALAKVRKPT